MSNRVAPRSAPNAPLKHDELVDYLTVINQFDAPGRVQYGDDLRIYLAIVQFGDTIGDAISIKQLLREGRRVVVAVDFRQVIALDDVAKLADQGVGADEGDCAAQIIDDADEILLAVVFGSSLDVPNRQGHFVATARAWIGEGDVFALVALLERQHEAAGGDAGFNHFTLHE